MTTTNTRPTTLLPHEAERNPVVFAKDGEAFANSRSVAAFFDKEHRNVLQAIDGLLSAEPDLGLRNFQQGSYTLPGTGSQQHRCFDMNRDGFTLLAMGFTGGKALKWKLRYIDAFNAMEAELRSRPVDPMAMLNDPASMRGLLLTYSEKVLALQNENASLVPKVEALERLAESEGSFCITDAAKTLQVQPNTLFRFLRSHGWIYRRPNTTHDVAYQSKLAAGLLEHKTTTITRSDGSEKTATQVRVTPRGLARLAEELPSAVRVV